MSTITSPRLSITSLVSPTSSRRPSVDGVSGSRTASPSAPSRRGQYPQRNRSALRDYYNIKPTTPAPGAGAGAGAGAGGTAESRDELQVEERELDRSGFDANGYVNGLLSKEGLDGILRTESTLVNEIRFLDGERKALVYDNYSKLISATDTIRKMRANMEPLTTATSTLSPAIAHIAETSASLATSLHMEESPTQAEHLRKEKQRARARWLLEAPVRIDAMIKAGRVEPAQRAMLEVRPYLEKWQGVDGVAEVESECYRLLKDAEGAE